MNNPIFYKLWKKLIWDFLSKNTNEFCYFEIHGINASYMNMKLITQNKIWPNEENLMLRWWTKKQTATDKCLNIWKEWVQCIRPIFNWLSSDYRLSMSFFAPEKTKTKTSWSTSSFSPQYQNCTRQYIFFGRPSFTLFRKMIL